MRSISLHPTSLALGLAFGVLVLLSMSQVPVLSAKGVNIQYLPHPRDMIVIREGTPYTVPAGRILVMTALGNTDGSGSVVWLRVNGQTELTNVFVYAQNPPSVAPIAPGLTFQAGSIVEAVANSNVGRAYGYLASQ